MPLNNLKHHIDKVLSVGLIGLMASLLLVVVWQIFSRFVLQDPSSFTDELSRYLLIWVALFGSAFVTGQGQHLAIDLLYPSDRHPIKRKLVNGLIMLFGLAVMGLGGARLVWITLALDQQSSSLGIPLGYVYLAVPLSGLLIGFYALLEIINTDKS